jgi:CheY-like chemotaxis protein
MIHRERRTEVRSRPQRRVLVVDDDPDSRLLIGAMIESYLDAVVTLVPTVEEAIASASRVLPDLVVTDALMPEQDGFDLLRRLRAIARAARVPVIVATATTEPALHARLLAAGATAVLAKPPTPQELTRAVGAALAYGDD